MQGISDEFNPSIFYYPYNGAPGNYIPDRPFTKEEFGDKNGGAQTMFMDTVCTGIELASDNDK